MLAIKPHYNTENDNIHEVHKNINARVHLQLFTEGVTEKLQSHTTIQLQFGERTTGREKPPLGHEYEFWPTLILKYIFQ